MTNYSISSAGPSTSYWLPGELCCSLSEALYKLSRKKKKKTSGHIEGREVDHAGCAQLSIFNFLLQLLALPTQLQQLFIIFPNTMQFFSLQISWFS